MTLDIDAPATTNVARRAVGGSLLLRRQRRAVVWTLVLLATLGLQVVGSATLGAARIPLQTTAGVLLESGGLATAWAADASETQRKIVRAVRLPRILAAVLVGAALGLV